jgi:sulfofructose kinase
MADVVGFGESSVDHVHVVEALPAPGVSKVRISSRYSASGGQVATTVAACAALGLSAGYLGPIGHDENGERVRADLLERGVDTSRILIREAANRYAVILVEEHTGARVVLWHRDAGLDVDANALAPRLIAGAKIVHVDATDEQASITLARAARAGGALVTCDIDAVTPQTAELLGTVTIPILAEDVPQQMTGITGTEAALRALRARHSGLLCVTLGPRGAAALDGDRFVHVPAVAVSAVDTTAAGDVFRAGVIYATLDGWPTERMLRFANAAAAVSCTRRGAMSSVPSLADVESLLR